MAGIVLDELLHDVARQAGLPEAPTSLVRRMVEATLSSLARELPANDVHALEVALPAELASSVRGASVSERPHGFFERVARDEQQSLPAATEHAESVLRVLGSRLDDDLVLRMKKHLPAEIAAHLESTVRAELPTRPMRTWAPKAAPRNTLASGRPGSEHPVSESRPVRAHADSVARSNNPHGDIKVSSARGLTQERLRESLAEGAPPQPRRTVAGG